MAKGSSISANPMDSYRKKMRKREVNRNKEVRRKVREVSILYKDTTKIERKIEQLKANSRLRKLTTGEKEKLSKLEEEFRQIVEKQRAAGIDPKRTASVGESVGYDPLAGYKDMETSSNSSGSSESDSGGGDSDSDDGSGHREQEPSGSLGYDDELGIPTAAASQVALSDAPSGAHDSEQPTKDSALPAMPPGTPPLLPEDMDVGTVWPPLPKGPSPLYSNQNGQLQAFRSRERGRGRGRGRGSGRGRGGGHEYIRYSHNSLHQRQHPYAEGHHRANSRGTPTSPHLHNAPQIAHHISAAAQVSSSTQQPKPSHGTVLSAEPRVRDLKKELTTLVPSAITRKNKQKERQRVLSSVPMVPKMIVNAAPDVDASLGSGDAASSLSRASSMLSGISPIAGVQFSIPQPKQNQQKPSQNGSTNKPHKPAGASSIDEEYRKFMEEMGNML